MVFMVRQVLFLSSLLLLGACGKQAEFKCFNTDSLRLEFRNGVAYHNNVPFTGTVFELNKANDTVLIRTWNKGKEHGEWKHFYSNGQLAELRYFKNGTKVDTLKRWWESGQAQLQCSFKNGEYHGLLQEWNKDGLLTKEMHYNEGYENGSQKMYYNNGKVRCNYVVKDGKRIGLLGTKNCVNVSDSIFK